MPRGFKFGDVAPELIAPFPINRAQLIPPPFCCNGIARLRDGVTIEQANADIERMLPIWLERFPFPGAGPSRAREVYLDTWRVAPALRPFKDDVIGGVRDVLWIVMAMIGIVLLIASANVANLLLVRGAGRAVELDVRAALGAGSWRIARVDARRERRCSRCSAASSGSSSRTARCRPCSRSRRSGCRASTRSRSTRARSVSRSS